MLPEPIQLELFLGEIGENPAHIAKLENEARDGRPKEYRFVLPPGVQLVKKKAAPVEVVPWPKHMRFD